MEDYECILITGDKSELNKIHQYIKSILEQISQSKNVPPPAQIASTQAADTSDITDKLTKLADLYRAGLLTEQEFLEMKRRLLGSINDVPVCFLAY